MGIFRKIFDIIGKEGKEAKNKVKEQVKYKALIEFKHRDPRKLNQTFQAYKLAEEKITLGRLNGWHINDFNEIAPKLNDIKKLINKQRNKINIAHQRVTQVISSKHLTLEWHKDVQRYFITDFSSYGTFVGAMGIESVKKINKNIALKLPKYATIMLSIPNIGPSEKRIRPFYILLSHA